MSEDKKKKEIIKQEVQKDTPEIKNIDEEIVKKAAEQSADEIKELFKDTEIENLTEQNIQNNEIVFEHEGTEYRVRKSNYNEKQKANDFRMKKYVELLRNEDCLLEKDLRELYKKRGIDIGDMDKEILELSKQQQDLMLELGKAIKEDKNKTELEDYKNEIVNILSSIQGLNQEKQRLLEISLENRLLTEVYSYLIWLVSEKKVDGKWVQVWDEYEDFMSSDLTELLAKITKNGAVIISNELSNSALI